MKVINLSAEQTTQIETLRKRIRELKEEIEAREKEKNHLAGQITKLLHDLSGIDMCKEARKSGLYFLPEISDDSRYIVVVQRDHDRT